MSGALFTYEDSLDLLSGYHSRSSKRERDEVDLRSGEDHEWAFESASKKISIALGLGDNDHEDIFAPNPVATTNTATGESVVSGGNEDMKPYPYYNYRDFSIESDPDPLTPLTPPGRVPNFPAKMHAILSRTDLMDIISWMPHGRAWRVHKPREFEVRVIPTYFEHAKFSSFIRQANGWGFRRITHGRDKNSYYHPLFLRGLPYLCKKMKRPGVSEKLTIDPDHEPDLYMVSNEFPVPMKADDESVMLHCTLQGGPKARMPICSASLMTSMKCAENITSSRTVAAATKLTPSDQQALAAFQQSLGASESQLAKTDFAVAARPPANISKPIHPVVSQSNLKAASASVSFPLPSVNAGTKSSPLALANQLAFSGPNMNSPMPPGSASSQFVAGFAAATALSQQQFQQMFLALQQQGVVLPDPAASQRMSHQRSPSWFPPQWTQQHVQPSASRLPLDNLLDSFSDDDFGLPAGAIDSSDDFWQ